MVEPNVITPSFVLVVMIEVPVRVVGDAVPIEKEFAVMLLAMLTASAVVLALVIVTAPSRVVAPRAAPNVTEPSVPARSVSA